MRGTSTTGRRKAGRALARKCQGGEIKLRAEVYKVPHHGSSRQDPDFLAATGAKLALLEVGLNNTYGHPAAKTLRALEGLGMQIVRTDQQGAVAISVGAGQRQVTTLR